MNKTELLSPAGNKFVAFKAVDSGADAIYTAYSRFGARAAAGNSFEDLAEIISYAHKFRVKVYVTINTILKDSEIEDVKKLILKLKKIKADAVIIQDFGILELDIPEIRFHASTQCHNNTPEKIKFLEKTGFKRVILPREITIDEIKNIKQNTNIELECFIHGALCVSYSGQCYLSFVKGGRSANRGECAQPCRQKYSLFDENNNCIVKDKYLLSLKDLNLSSRLEELIDAGITSFKIEGRLKNEEYVANATAFYSGMLNDILKRKNRKRSSQGTVKYDFTPDLSKTFNRGFCEFNIDGKKKKIATLNYTSSPGEYAGTVKTLKNGFFTLDKIFNFNNGDGICFFDSEGTLNGTNINKTVNEKVYPADIKKIKPGMKIYRNYDKEYNDILKTSRPDRKIEIDIRMRETDFAYILFADDEENNTACLMFEKKYEPSQNKEKSLGVLKSCLSKTGDSEFSVKSADIKIKTVPFIKISEINELRRNLIAKLQYLREKNYKLPSVSEIKLTEYPVKTLDYRANIFNKKAEEFCKKRGCEIKEKALETQTDFSGKEVMISKYCIKNELNLCPKQNSKNISDKLFLKSEFNEKFLVEFCCKDCVMKVKKL